MTTPKPKGGARPGAGRKKTGRKKKYIPIAVSNEKIEIFGIDNLKKYLQIEADKL